MKEFFQIFLIFYMVLICVLGSIFNLIALVIFYLNFMNYSSILIFFSLSLVNLISSVVLVPIEISKLQKIFYSDTAICSISYFLKIFFQFQSELLIVLLALERFKSTVVSNANQMVSHCAFRYNRNLAVTISFLVSALFASISFGFHDFVTDSLSCEEKNYSKICIFEKLTSALFGVQLVFITFMFLRVYLMAYKSSLKVSFIATNNKNLVQTSLGTTSSEIANQSSLVESIRVSNFKRIRNDFTIAKLFILV